MKPSLIVANARIVTPDAILEKANLIVDGATIIAVESGTPPAGGATLIDASGLTLLPGFVDVHVHGGGGRDAMDATPDALRAVCRTHARHGTTSLLATTMTQSGPAISAALRNARLAVDAGPDFCTDGAQFVGIHLEGPYISPRRPGAQPAQYVRPWDRDEWAGWLSDAGGTMRLITLAPEIEHGYALVEACRRQNIVVSLGHTDATDAQAHDAFARGATHGTHLFNAMPPLHHRAPGAAAALLATRGVHVEIIADGHHVAPEMIRLAVAAKGPREVILITDAIAGAGASEGQYELGGNPVTVKDGRATLADGTLAGSVLTMGQAVRNVHAWCPTLSLSDLTRMSSTNAADELGMSNMGRITPGADADFVLLDDELNVRATYVAGRQVYAAP